MFPALLQISGGWTCWPTINRIISSEDMQVTKVPEEELRTEVGGKSGRISSSPLRPVGLQLLDESCASVASYW